MKDEPQDGKPRDVPTRPSLLARLRGNGSGDARDWEEGWFEFDQIYRPVLQGFARSRHVPEAEIDDLCQNILLAVRRSIDGFQYDRARCRFQTWLFTVARNHIVNHLRRSARGSGVVLEPETQLVDMADPAPCPDALWQLEFDRSLARVAWEMVRKSANPEYVRLYRKHVLEECSVPETIAYFRDPELTADRIHQAKHRITALLAQTVRNLRRNPLFF